MNRQWLYAKQPQGKIAADTFEWTETAIPVPRDGEVLVQTRMLSLDPANRAWMMGKTYRDALEPGQVMSGFAIGEVVESKTGGLKAGDIVEGDWGWQDYAALPARRLVKRTTEAPLEMLIGPLSVTGLTAYFGLLEVGQPKPGETVVVSAASGAVGQVVGQIAKIMGCRVVGIAGGAKKCAFVKDELGFDACLDYKAEKDLDAALRAACPNGPDVYFDNVGGEISDAVLRNINFFGRVALCGSISQYNATTPPMGPRLLGTFVGKRVRAQGFIVTDFAERYAPARRQMGEWIKSGKLKYREDIVEGIDKAPRAFIGLLRGENFGKMLVKLA
jgi:NADPH-dependent curcumin reductase CurA